MLFTARGISLRTPSIYTNIRRAKAAVQDGQYNKALKALTSDGLAPPTPEVLQEMLNKTASPLLPQVQRHLHPLSLKRPSKRGTILPKRLSPRPFWPAPKEAVDCPSPDQANNMLSSLTKFVNHLAAGQAPPSILPHLCGATLLEKNGGLRPIAVGSASPLPHALQLSLCLPPYNWESGPEGAVRQSFTLPPT